jgi:nitrite reductase/ring-hydroxylating ferredoxin subunit
VPPTRQRIAAEGDLAEGRTRKFRFQVDGIAREGFVARFQGQLVAYENVCRHHPLPLDYGDGRFFTPEGDHFICQTHGAVYEPLTGKCVQGPCAGASLKPLPLEVIDGVVWLRMGEE